MLVSIKEKAKELERKSKRVRGIDSNTKAMG